MTELMKKYEAETDEIATWHWHDKEFVTDDYIAWLESQLTWRDVSEELPEESHIVLASYTNACGKRRHVRAEYVPRFTQEFDYNDNEGSYEYREEDDTYYLKEGWYELIDNWGDFTSVLIVEGVVDKWLPIPKEQS